MVAKRTFPLKRRLQMWAGPAALGVGWLAAAFAAGGLAWMQHTTGTTTALAVTRAHALAAPESGWVADVAVKAGASVEAGAPIARLEVPGMAQDLEAAEAEVRVAEEGVRMSQANRDLKGAATVERAQRALLAAEVQLEADRSKLAQLESAQDRLAASGVATPAGTLEQGRVAITGQQATVDKRQSEVAALEKGFSDARTGAAMTFDGEGVLAAAVARRDALLAREAAGQIKAPAAGIIGAVLPTPGEWTTAGTPLVTITEPVSNEVVAYVAVPYARGLKPGIAVRITPDGGSVVNGTIAQIGPALELVPDALHPMAPNTFEMPVHVVTSAELVPGETVEVDL